MTGILLFPTHNILSLPHLTNDPVGLFALCECRARDIEQNVHFFKRETLCLGHKEEDDHNANHNKCTKQEEHAIGNVFDHIRSRIDNDELSKPLGAGSEYQTDRANGSRENLGAGQSQQRMLVIGIQGDCTNQKIQGMPFQDIA